MGTYAVIYTYTDDAASRDEHRPEHKVFLEDQYKAGRLRVSGPFGPESDPGALLVFEGDSVEDVAALLDQEPFYKRGLIADRDIRAWQIFFGGLQ
ncbi:YciI family protein [Haloactinomyces albus]|uniref:Uncharacterized protein YciI n=1 Tax=Haloactinomyces albus TaxID=1352928 RepID=A0AAE3ZAL8_9ACTN|nr:YciI family protein [Haloactinomyces albus]MDR7300420.1 uncharacterized protein YciI [Haloactinomyces albus]